ncbi:lycopene cyclase domain-containing protein [Natronomonas marina]|uniref:lycopene cyclase domain-containing protein n=1 Tax=Natronomonas marina TaxID=2961939 RepID=UPI0020C99020|nr:lycopene cyclase domain-containing protein [Natronomonas marina]
MSGPSYLQFHVAFLVPALSMLAAAAVVTRTRTPRRTVWSVGGSSYWVGVAVVTLLAVVYTTPWDNYLISRGVWGYGDGRTLVHLWLAPLGEYLFFVLQPVLTALWLGQLTLREGWPEPGLLRGGDLGSLVRREALSVAPRLLAGAVAVGLGVAGLALLSTPSTLYLGAILAWSAPVLLLQWVVGAPQLYHQRRVLAVGVAVPTVYLWVVDRIAIATGIWHISAEHTTGLAILGLPIEEALFFAVTNLFVVQGLVLFRWVMDRWR